MLWDGFLKGLYAFCACAGFLTGAVIVLLFIWAVCKVCGISVDDSDENEVDIGVGDDNDHNKTV